MAEESKGDPYETPMRDKGMETAYTPVSPNGNQFADQGYVSSGKRRSSKSFRSPRKAMARITGVHHAFGNESVEQVPLNDVASAPSKEVAAPARVATPPAADSDESIFEVPRDDDYDIGVPPSVVGRSSEKTCCFCL